jgi:hypothetical protein
MRANWPARHQDKKVEAEVQVEGGEAGGWKLEV